MLQPDNRERSFIERNLGMGIYTLALFAVLAAYNVPQVSTAIRNGLMPEGSTAVVQSASEVTNEKLPQKMSEGINLETLHVGDIVRVPLRGKFRTPDATTALAKISSFFVDQEGTTIGFFAAPLKADGTTIDALLDAYTASEIVQ